MRSEINTQSSHLQNEQFKIRILGRIMIISVVFTLFFALLDTFNLNHIGTIQATNNYIHAACVLPVYYLFKQKKLTFLFCAHYFLAFCFFISISAILFAPNDDFRAVWFFLSIMISFIFVGQNFGRLYGYGSMVFIAFTGFALESNFNTESVLSILISLLVLILVMTAYTGQMEKHLNHIDQIQQELYYLANKSPISTSLTSNDHALKIEQLFKNAQALNENFALMYIDLNNLDDIKTKYDTTIFHNIQNELVNHITPLISSSDIISTMNNALISIALPNKDSISIQQLIEKVNRHISDTSIHVNGHQIKIDICIAVTTINPQDTGIRSLHIRADKALTKAKLMEGSQIVLIDV